MKSLTFQQKNKLLILGTGLLLLAVYFLSIQKTINLYQSNQALRRQIQLAKQAPAQISQLQARLNQWGSVFTTDSSSAEIASTHPETLRQELFEKVGKYTQQYEVQLQSFQPAEVFAEGSLQVETHTLLLEGSFQDQLRVSEALEKSLRHGRVASLSFATRQERRSKQTYLIGALSIQGINEQHYEP